MDPENSCGPRDLSENNNGNSIKVDFNETTWNCVTSKKFLACYFEHLKEEEENRDGTIRSKPEDEKKITCSIEEYQQSVPILMESTWHTNLCECFNCLKMYQNHNVEFLFGIKTIECLPTEMLIMIFTQLSASDRRFASESCKRFLEIWLCDDFINDRRLVFDCCVLDQYQEPLSVLMKSSRNYRTLAFGRVDIRNVSTFLAKFAQTVATIEFLESSRHCSLQKIIWYLWQFPNLKLMNVETWKFFNVPRNLELLAISDVHGACSFNVIQDLDPKYFVNTSDSFRVELNLKIPAKQVLNLTELLRNKIQRINLAFLPNIDVKLPRFENLKHLELHFEKYCSLRTEDILENMEERFPALEHLSIKTMRIPHKNWSCLKTLETLYVPQNELSRLKIYENLTELILDVCVFNKYNCFFVHEAFLNKNLKTLKINSVNNISTCFTCFKTMTKSFPNLEHLTFKYKITNGHLRKLAANTPKLKYLSLCRDPRDPSLSLQYLPNLTELVFDWSTISATMIKTWPLMLNLGKFRFQMPRLDSETVKFFEKIPAVEVLDMQVNDINGDHMLLFEAMAKSLKRLRKLRFDGRKLSRFDYPPIADVYAVNCKHLQYIDFPSLCGKDDIEETLLPKMKHPTLRSINHKPLFTLKSQTK